MSDQLPRQDTDADRGVCTVTAFIELEIEDVTEAQAREFALSLVGVDVETRLPDDLVYGATVTGVTSVGVERA